MNEDPEVDAILVQIPLPEGFDEDAALLSVTPDKDADGLNPINLGRLVIGKPGPRTLHAQWHPRPADALRRTDRRETRGDRRSRTDHRPSPVPAPVP